MVQFNHYKFDEEVSNWVSISEEELSKISAQNKDKGVYKQTRLLSMGVDNSTPLSEPINTTSYGYAIFDGGNWETIKYNESNDK